MKVELPFKSNNTDYIITMHGECAEDCMNDEDYTVELDYVFAAPYHSDNTARFVVGMLKDSKRLREKIFYAALKDFDFCLNIEEEFDAAENDIY